MIKMNIMILKVKMRKTCDVIGEEKNGWERTNLIERI